MMKFMKLTGLIIALIFLTSCSGFSNMPIIPDTMKDSLNRQAAVIDEVVQKFQEDGVTVWFYPRQMRVIIEVDKDKIPQTE